MVIVQSSVLVRTNSTGDHLGALTAIVTKLAEEISLPDEDGAKLSLGGQLYDLIAVSTYSLWVVSMISKNIW